MKEDDLRRRYSVDPFSKHNSHLRDYSVKYNIWTERFVPCLTSWLVMHFVQVWVRA